jgi:Tol biopolymer transport system component
LPLAQGSSVAHYRIAATIGAGGMGEVYRATDTRLGRDVALKLLPEAVASDPDRLARFEREAKVLASLNHPGIAQLYAFESATTADPSSPGPDGLLGMTGQKKTHFLVMELVEGADLGERLKRGPIPVDEAIGTARQVAEALEEAHEKGIVHRDLKPANVKVTADGKVKVLDFGLAKAWAGDGPGATSSADLSQSPTLAQAGTAAGLILGTAAYMAPEQARGKAVDKRADIWAFGVLLWEMLTGRRLFDGDTVSDVLASVLRQELDWTALPASTPAELRRLLGRCLDRNPRQRLHDIADARIGLDEIVAGKGAGAGPDAATGLARRRAWLLGAGGIAAGLVVGWLASGRLVTRPGADDAPAFHAEFDVAAPDRTSLVAGLALSPDGQRLAFVARGEDGRTALWVRPLASTEAKMLPGSTDARYPFWSPDARKIAFFAQNRLKVTELFGGQPRVLTETGSTQDVRGGAWGAGDVIVFAPSFVGPLLSVSVRDGKVAPATRIAEGSGVGTHRFPSFLPDGRRFLIYASSGTGTEPGTLWLGELGSLDPKLLGPSTSRGVWAPPGHVLYVTGDSLVAHRFDDRRNELAGDPMPLGISLAGTIAVSGLRSLAAAENGVVVYRADKRDATRLVVTDRAGAEIETVTPGRSTFAYAPRLSPDGRRLVLTRYEPGATNGELWLHDLERRVDTRLTLGTEDVQLPAWSPDGREVAYASIGGEPGTGGIYRLAVDRPGQRRRVLPSDAFAAPDAWTPDGRRIVFVQTSPQGRNSLWSLSLEGDPAPRPLGQDQASEWGSDLSPDGRFLAYASDASRRWEVYVRPLDSPGGEVRVSSEGGFAPRWRRDGRELFYVDDNRRLMAVPVLSLDPPTFGPPAALFAARLEEASDRQYDVFPDGRRFVLSRTLAEEREPISVVLGWTARLEKAPHP